MLDKNKVSVGIHPLAWTNDDLPEMGKDNTFEQCISEIALSGYAGSEIGCKYPTDANGLKKALDLRGIRICNSWFSSHLISKPYAETEVAFKKHIDFLAALGARVIGLSEQSYSTQGRAIPIFEQRHVMNDGEWRDLCDGLNKLGRIAKEKGIKLTFHHHMGTVVQSAEEIDRLMEGTKSDLVYLLFDSGHLAYCDEDYLAVLHRYAGRIAHVHLKDTHTEIVRRVRQESLSFLDGIRAGAFAIPGDGHVDFPSIFSALEKSAYEGWIVVEAEQDPAVANPLEYALKARKYIRETAGI